MKRIERERGSRWRGRFLPLPGAAFCLVALAALWGGVAPTHAEGSGDLLVAPTRVVFEARRRSAEVTLVNIGTDTATYRISFVHQRMKPDGSLEAVDTPGPGEAFADDLVRFSPRQVTLEPRVAQTVRMQLRIPAGLTAGEYRSHLLFRAIPPPPPPRTPRPPLQPGSALR